MENKPIVDSLKTKKKRNFFKKDEKIAYALLAFPIFWWCIFFLYAFVKAIFFSFTDLGIDISMIHKISLDNYARLFTDEVFGIALRNTLIWTLATTFFNNLFGLLIAYLITKMKRGQKLFLTLLFWPTLVSAVISSDITKVIFSPSDTGIMNTIIQFFGGKPLAWYNDPKLSLITLMIIPTLLGFSTQMMIYYVAIKGINKDYLEAAEVDGASNFQIFKSIYLPLITKALNYNIVLSIIGGIRVIGPMQLVSNGGPNYSSTSVILYMYNNMTTEMGYACTIGVITTIVILILTFIQTKFTDKEVM